MVEDALTRLPKQGDIVDDVDAVIPFVPVDAYKDRVYVPKDLRTRIMKRYHYYCYHPGEARMHKTIASTLY